jgi:GxxExxY protein
MLHERITNQIIGAFFEIYRTRGYGFLESVYANSLAVEIGLRGLQVRREIPVQVDWKAVVVGTYRIDLLVEKAVLVEVKTVESIVEAHQRQLVNYLKATDVEVGLLLNFGPDPHFIRRVNTKDR